MRPLAGGASVRWLARALIYTNTAAYYSSNYTSH